MFVSDNLIKRCVTFMTFEFKQNQNFIPSFHKPSRLQKNSQTLQIFFDTALCAKVIGIILKTLKFSTGLH